MEKKFLAVALLLPLLVTQPALALNQENNQSSQEKPYAMQVDVPMTVVDLVFTNKKGDILGIKFDTLEDARSAIEVAEDGVPQTIEFFEPSEAPLTTVLVVEATPLFGQYLRYQNLQAAAIFLQELRKNDWIGLVSYDMKPRLEVDFTHNKEAIYQALNAMWIGGFSEVNTFDAIADTLDRLKEAEQKGKTSIIVIGTGFNTLSRATFDGIIKIARRHRTAIFCINTTWILERYLDRLEAYGYRTDSARMNIGIARIQMHELAKTTGGTFHVPRFETELPEIYRMLAASLRVQHTIGYKPTNRNFDGKKRKIEIRLTKEFETRIRTHFDLNGDGVIDKKDLKEKIMIRHRTEYIPGKVE